MVPMEPADLVQPGQAKRLAEARAASGRDPGELASLLGITWEAYRDLEDFDEEVVDALTYDQLLVLAGAIGLDLRRFFEAGPAEATFAELAARLASAGALEELEERAGWEFRKQVEDPASFGELPPIALADIGALVGVDRRPLYGIPAGGERDRADAQLRSPVALQVAEEVTSP